MFFPRYIYFTIGAIELIQGFFSGSSHTFVFVSACLLYYVLSICCENDRFLRVSVFLFSHFRLAFSRCSDYYSTIHLPIGVIRLSLPFFSLPVTISSSLIPRDRVR